jgi:hypothetical protein
MNEHDNGHDEHQGKHVFFFSTHRLDAPRDRMKVSELKDVIASHIPEFKRDHTLVMEECGDRPDKPLNDQDEVHIHEFPHYYDQPPANFG